MPSKKTKVKAKSKKKELKISLGLLALIIMGLFLFGDLIYMVKIWATPPKSIPVSALYTLNGETSPSGVFKAWDVAASASNIYLSDQPNNRIVVFDAKGKYLDSITNKQAGKPDFKEISCLTLSPNGDIYCMDTWNALIRGFHSPRQPLAHVNIAEKGFFGARGIAYSNGYFYVADTGSQRIAKVSPEGDVIASWGRHGSGKGEFNNPYQIVVDDQEHFYVNDKENHRIECIDANGKYLWEVSTYWPPVAEAVDKTNHLLYVSTGQSVLVYDLNGKLFGALAVIPKADDGFVNVTALSVFPNGDVVACRGNNLTVYHPAAMTPVK